MAKVRMTIKKTGDRLLGIEAYPEWAETAWKATLFFQGRQYTTAFFTGAAWKEAPTASDVLTCLVNDAIGLECSDGLYDWADQLGIVTTLDDIAKAKTTYKAVEKQTARLRALFGAQYEDFICLDEDEIEEICGLTTVKVMR